MSTARRTIQLGLLFTIAVVAVLSLASEAAAQTIQPFATSCKMDAEVSTKELETVDQVALEFVRKAVGPDSSLAYASFTADAKRTLTFDQFSSAFQMAIKPMGPFHNTRTAHTYIATVTGGSQDQRVVCGNLSSPEGWVAVNAKPGTEQAHVIVESETVNNSVVFVVWLVPEQGEWHVQYVDFATSEMAGQSAGDLLKLAETQQQEEHNFNAFILYAAALQLADRGPFFQLGIRPMIQKQLGTMNKPDDFQGPPPFTWSFGTNEFKILNVGPIGVGGKIYLLIDHQVEPWTDDKVADRENRDLMAAFGKTHPEYKDVFAGLVVRAHERGGSKGYGTVEENQRKRD